MSVARGSSSDRPQGSERPERPERSAASQRSERSERRAAPRFEAQALGGSLVCRVNPGHDVELSNLSSVGARVAAGFALLPGRVLQLHLQGRRRVVIETRVAWCAVTRVTAQRGLRFDAGLAFARWVDLATELAVRPHP